MKLTLSPALALLTLVWQKNGQRSWQVVNWSMRDALKLAIASGMKFAIGDFKYCAHQFRSGYWIGSEQEWVYTDAILNENASCIKAWEEYRGRAPFIGNNVRSDRSQSYLHTGTIMRQRERLAVGMSFPYEKATWYVTSFDDAKGLLRAVRYSNNRGQSGKPKKLKSFTHQEIKDIFPAPKKAVVAGEAQTVVAK